ncbi:MAG: DUF4097 family beta strand repeat-containing protein [Vulcanimicrobiaceae bacterium]
MRVSFPLATLFATVALAGCVSIGGGISNSHAYHQSLHRSFATSGPASVHVTNVSGSIAVRAWNKPEVQIDALKYGGSRRDLTETDVAIDRHGNTIRVHTKYLKQDGAFGLDVHHGASIDYTLHVPARTALEIKNVSGSVRVEGIAGRVRVADVSGSIKVSDVGGDVRIATTSGSIDASMPHLAGNTSVDIATVSGSINLTIPKNSSASLKMGTAAGSISSTFPLQVKKETVGSSATGRIGRGSASVHLATVAGSISIGSN